MHKAQTLLGPWLNERATLAPHTRAYADSRIHGLTHAHSHLARVRPHAIHNNARKHHHSHQHTFTTHTHTHTHTHSGQDSRAGRRLDGRRQGRQGRGPPLRPRHGAAPHRGDDHGGQRPPCAGMSMRELERDDYMRCCVGWGGARAFSSGSEIDARESETGSWVGRRRRGTGMCACVCVCVCVCVCCTCC